MKTYAYTHTHTHTHMYTHTNIQMNRYRHKHSQVLISELPLFLAIYLYGLGRDILHTFMNCQEINGGTHYNKEIKIKGMVTWSIFEGWKDQKQIFNLIM